MSYSRNVQMHKAKFCELGLSQGEMHKANAQGEMSYSLLEFVKKLKFPQLFLRHGWECIHLRNELRNC